VEVSEQIREIPVADKLVAFRMMKQRRRITLMKRMFVTESTLIKSDSLFVDGVDVRAAVFANECRFAFDVHGGPSRSGMVGFTD